MLALSAVLAGAATVDPVFVEIPPGSRANVEASAITYDPRNGVAVATGRVEITYGPYVLIASRVTYNTNTDTFTANGSVSLQEPSGNVLEADRAQLTDRFKEGFAHHLRLLLTNDATLSADYARRSEGYITVFETVTYTACKYCVSSDGTPVWALKSDVATHDQREKTVTHENTTLEFGGVPVLWLPYLSHPDPSVKKRTGFLIPNAKYNSRFGFGLEVPYFIDLAPDYDLTLTPMLTTKQGLLLQTEWRQRLSTGSYSIDSAGIYQLDPDEMPERSEERWRGAVRARGAFQPTETWSWGFDGTLVSDRYFLDDYDVDKRDEAVSEVYLSNLDDRNYFLAQALHYRTLEDGVRQDTLPYALPYIQHSYVFGQPILGGELSLDSSVYNLSREAAHSPFEGIDQATDQTRAVAQLAWQRQFVTGMGQLITPFARLRADLYITDNKPDPLIAGFESDTETTTRLLPAAGIDMRWPFLSYSEAGQHILTPVAQIITAADETKADRISNEDAIGLNFDHTSLFLHDRFTGLDRYEGGTRANLGVLYTYQAPDGGYLRASLGESFHIAGRNSFALGSGLESARSDLVVALAAQPYDFLNLSYQARLEEDLSRLISQEASVSLTFDRISGSFDYIDLDAEPAYGREDPQEQVAGDVSFRLHGPWMLFAGARYDLDDSEFVTKTLGVGYKCDCMEFKLAYTEDGGSLFGDVDRSIKMSLSLKTLGSASVGTGF